MPEFETPWTAFVVHVPQLLSLLELELEHERAVVILQAVSDLIRFGSCETCEDVLSQLAFPAGETGRRHRQFIEAVMAMPDEQREACCFSGLHPRYELRDGTPIPEIVARIYGSEMPIGMIEAALVHLKNSGAWSMPASEWPDAGSKFYRCGVLKFRPSGNTNEPRQITPLLYLASHDPVDALEIWEAQNYIGVLTRAYGKTAEAMQNEWLRTVPSAATPDPVFAFINEPSQSRAASALVWVSASFERLRAGIESREPERDEHQIRLKLLTDRTAETLAHLDSSPKRHQREWPSNPPQEGSRHKFGPLAGTLTRIAEVANMSVPTLYANNVSSFFYIRRITGQRYQVWLDSQKMLAAWNRELGDFSG